MFEVRLKYKYEDIYRFREIDKISNSSVENSPNVSKISSKSPLGSVRTSAVRNSRVRTSGVRTSGVKTSSANLLPLAKKLTGLNSAGNSRNTSHRGNTDTNEQYKVIVPGHLMPKYS